MSREEGIIWRRVKEGGEGNESRKKSGRTAFKTKISDNTEVAHTKVRKQVEIYQHIRGATNVVVIEGVARESLGCVSLWP